MSAHVVGVKALVKSNAELRRDIEALVEALRLTNRDLRQAREDLRACQEQRDALMAERLMPLRRSA